jgi:hypothetical protein
MASQFSDNPYLDEMFLFESEEKMNLMRKPMMWKDFHPVKSLSLMTTEILEEMSQYYASKIPV